MKPEGPTATRFVVALPDNCRIVPFTREFRLS